MPPPARQNRGRRPPKAAAAETPQTASPEQAPETPSWEQETEPENSAPEAALQTAPEPETPVSPESLQDTQPGAPQPSGDTETQEAEAEPPPRPPTWEDAVVQLASRLAHPRFPAADLARLRRLTPEQPAEPLFWQLLTAVEPPPAGPAAEAKWAAIIQGLALMTPNQGRGRPTAPEGWWPAAHTPEIPAGTALARGGASRSAAPPFYAEQRLNLLLNARGPRLREIYIQACRLLGNVNQAANCRQLAGLLFTDYPPGAPTPAGKRLRQRLARDYYRELRRRAAGPSRPEAGASANAAAAPAPK